MSSAGVKTREAGFSILESLVVVAVASTLIVVLSSTLTSSQMGARRFVENTQQRTNSIFFDRQFSRFVSGILASYIDDRGMPVGLRGGKDWLEGHTNETLIELTSPSRFRVEVVNTDGSASVTLRLQDQQFDWYFERDTVIEFVYFDELGNRHEAWPPPLGGRTLRNRLEAKLDVRDQVLPQSIALERRSESGRVLRIYNLSM